MSANGSATCVTRWRVPSRQETTDERPLHGRLAADERFVAALARRDLNSLRVFHRNGIPIRRWRTAWRTACQAAGCAEPASSTIASAAARTLIRASVPERVAILLPSGVMGSAEFSDTTGLARGEPHQDR